MRRCAAGPVCAAVLLSLSACGETSGLVSRDPVPSTVAVRFVEPDGRASHYAVYLLGSRPRVLVALDPGLPDRAFRAVVQRKNGGLWLSVWSNEGRTGQDGTTTLTIPRLGPGPYRVHARFVGDAAHFGSESQWRYYVVRPPT